MIYSFLATVDNSISAVTKSISISISDAQGRNGSANIQVTVIGESLPITSGNQMIFPQIADGGGYRTVLLLTNGTVLDTTATVAFFSDTGDPLNVTIGSKTASSFPVGISARGSAKVVTSGKSSGVSTGWARVTSSPSVELNGNAIFQLYRDTTLFSEASVPAAIPVSSVGFYADEEGGFNTGFAMANPGTSTANGTLTLRSPAGVTKTEKTGTLSYFRSIYGR